MFELREKSALVCGCTRGIGRACAEVLASQGAIVTLVARDEAALETLASGLSTHADQRHEILVADFADPAGLLEKLTAYTANHAPVEILVNNTGGPPGGPLIDASADEFARAMNMHLHCNHHLVQAVVPGMKRLGTGRIINIISTSVKQPIPGLGVSNTTRGAVASWAKTLAAELAPFGITVNNVLPGYTATDRLRSLIAAKAKRQGRAPKDVEKAMIDTVPAGRLASAKEIAAAIAFLASSEAGFVNGINLPVDGGRTSCL